MSTNFKNQMKEVMSLAWSFVKRNGFSMSEALKCAWANMKLKEKQDCEVLFSESRWHNERSLRHALRKIHADSNR